MKQTRHNPYTCTLTICFVFMNRNCFLKNCFEIINLAFMGVWKRSPHPWRIGPCGVPASSIIHWILFISITYMCEDYLARLWPLWLALSHFSYLISRLQKTCWVDQFQNEGSFFSSRCWRIFNRVTGIDLQQKQARQKWRQTHTCKPNCLPAWPLNWNAIFSSLLGGGFLIICCCQLCICGSYSKRKFFFFHLGTNISSSPYILLYIKDQNYPW